MANSGTLSSVTGPPHKWEPIPKEITQIILRPVICYCSGTNQHKIEHIECRCDGFERFHQGRIAKYIPHFLKAINCYDEDGYHLCRYCGKIRFKHWLVHCPYCDKYFKGPKFCLGFICFRLAL